jgi:hypothetical protein
LVGVFLEKKRIFMFDGDMSKSETATLSTVIDARVKRALSVYCKRRGLKVGYVVEEALIERLEDEIDRDAYYARKDEELFSLEEVLSGRKRSKHAG